MVLNSRLIDFKFYSEISVNPCKGLNIFPTDWQAIKISLSSKDTQNFIPTLTATDYNTEISIISQNHIF